MTGLTKINFLADHILYDLRMIPRAYVLLDRIAANAEAFSIASDGFSPTFSVAWKPLMVAAIAFCERLAARVDGIVIEEAFDDLDLRDVDFDDDDIETLKLFALDPAYAAIAPGALDIVRQCRHIQVLVYTEDLRVAA